MQTHLYEGNVLGQEWTIKYHKLQQPCYMTNIQYSIYIQCIAVCRGGDVYYEPTRVFNIKARTLTLRKVSFS